MRLIRYIITNAAFAVCLWFGIIEGISGAANVALFIAWIAIVTSLFACSKDVIEKLAQRGRTVPMWIDQSFDLMVVAFLVWHGWWATAIGYVIHMGSLAVAYDRASKLHNPNSSHPTGSPV